MTDRREGEDSVRLDEQAARRLIERATELDARMASQSSVADLREAALAAGISDDAFRRALAEVRAEQAAPTAVVAPRRRRGVMTAVVIALALLAAAFATCVGTRLVARPPDQRVLPTVAPVIETPVIPLPTKSTKKTGPVPQKTVAPPTSKTPVPPAER